MIPGGSLSTQTYVAPFIGAKRLPYSTDIQYEDGGIALNNPSRGLQYQVWVGRKTSAGIELSAPSVTPFLVVEEEGIQTFSFTFTQNMEVTVAYIDMFGNMKLYWYDSMIPGMTTSNYGQGFSSPFVFMDDKRETQDQVNDVLFFFVLNGVLCYQQQRDRYLTIYNLKTGITTDILHVGMNKKLRVQLLLAKEDSDITGIPYIAEGIIPESTGTVWNDAQYVWNSAADFWDVNYYNPTGMKLLLSGYGDDTNAFTAGSFWIADSGATFGGAAYSSFVERVGLAIIGQRSDGSPNVDVTKNKFVRAVYPKMEIIEGTGLVHIYVGAQQNVKGPIIWEGPFEFDPATMEKINCTVNGKLIAVRFATPVDSQLIWRLDGYALDLDVGANW